MFTFKHELYITYTLIILLFHSYISDFPLVSAANHIRKGPAEAGPKRRISLFSERTARIDLQLLAIGNRDLGIAAARNIILHDAVASLDLPVAVIANRARGPICAVVNVLADLPDGLDTVIGSGRRVLSGGQAQRIALARAFLDKQRRVMIFDEPTAHLDIETELDLKKRMLPLMDHRLVFFATHRLHWMKEMDYILVMNHGQLVGQGTFADLQQHNEYFQQLMKEMRGED